MSRNPGWIRGYKLLVKWIKSENFVDSVYNTLTYMADKEDSCG